MTIEPFVRAEWEAHGALDREACHWIKDHADPGDQHPIVTAIDILRHPDVVPEVVTTGGS